jgi:hypothetical protein
MQSLFWAGKLLRETGIKVEQFGMKLQGDMAYKEQRKLLSNSVYSNLINHLVVRHRRLMPLFDKVPKVGEKTFIAPNASLIGRVNVGDKSSVWYGAVLRGDTIKFSTNFDKLMSISFQLGIIPALEIVQ